MGLTSKTGLLSSPTKKVQKMENMKTIQLRAIAGPAPYALKPFAGLYNPFPYGCSLLCNHPADTEARELLKKAKDTWATEGKNLLLADEVAAIRAGLEQLKTNETVKQTNAKNLEVPPTIESVPEELFRRYTETDSRPLTPAPTLASGNTRASGSRRCVTPDPLLTAQVKEKTLLVLDLRRSHSQETLSWYGSSHQEPPIIKIMRVPTRSTSPEMNLVESVTPDKNRRKNPRNLNVSSARRPKSNYAKGDEKEKAPQQLEVTDADKNIEEDSVVSGEEEEDEGFVKRRGKKKRKRGRDTSRGPPAFQSSIDPETQVATIGIESHNPSARPSLVPASSTQDIQESSAAGKSGDKSLPHLLDIESFLDKEILKLLRRELNAEVIDNEFDQKKRKALEEAYRTIPPDRTECEELKKLQAELKLAPVNAELWLSLPRVFTRSSARFELPMDRRSLSVLTPLEYVKEHVYITSARKLLYNCIFNKFKTSPAEENGIESDYRRKMSCKKLPVALNLMMGKDMSEEQSANFKQLIGWNEDEEIDFKTFCGLCALCERLLAPEYCPQLSNRTVDPCHEIERADFESLARRLHGQKSNPQLIEILNRIKTS